LAHLEACSFKGKTTVPKDVKEANFDPNYLKKFGRYSLEDVSC
jgi:hypothetical protein